MCVCGRYIAVDVYMAIDIHIVPDTDLRGGILNSYIQYVLAF